MSSNDYLALVELHLRNMLATVEGMEEEEEAEVILATMKGTGEDEDGGEVGRLLLFHNNDSTGILDISKVVCIIAYLLAPRGQRYSNVKSVFK